MKTTIELPEDVFRCAEVLAAERGMTLKQLFTEALEDYLTSRTGEYRERQTTPWMVGFGALAHLSEENYRILGLIEDEFEIPDFE